MIRYEDGNILDYCDNNNIVIHGVNAMVVMGAGVALALKTAFPEILEVDRANPLKGEAKLGSLSIYNLDYKYGKLCTIVNACTQYRYGPEFELFGFKTSQKLRKNAIRLAFEEIKRRFGNNGLTFVIPKIGAGLAGGNWEEISKIIEYSLPDEDIICVEFKNR